MLAVSLAHVLREVAELPKPWSVQIIWGGGGGGGAGIVKLTKL